MTPDCVFVLGAGASVPYGMPILAHLAVKVAETLKAPDRAVFENAVLETYGVHLGSPNASVDFEELLNRLDPVGLSYLDDNGLGQTLQDRKRAFEIALSGLRSYISIKSAEAAPNPGPYDKLVASLAPKSTVVSFNWDVLIEQAFRRADKEYAYLPRDGSDSRHLLLKPHGSINWYALLDREMLMVSSQSNLLAVGDSLQYYLLYLADPFAPIDFHWSSFPVEAALSKVPAIVPPQSSKLLSVGGQARDGFVEFGHTSAMKTIWRRFFETIRNAKTVVIIGYSLPGTDGSAITTLKAGLAAGAGSKRVLLVDPSDAVRLRYEALLGIPVDVLCKTFEDLDPAAL